MLSQCLDFLKSVCIRTCAYLHADACFVIAGGYINGRALTNTGDAEMENCHHMIAKYIGSKLPGLMPKEPKIEKRMETYLHCYWHLISF
jgi:hypothetical protein